MIRTLAPPSNPSEPPWTKRSRPIRNDCACHGLLELSKTKTQADWRESRYALAVEFDEKRHCGYCLNVHLPGPARPRSHSQPRLPDPTISATTDLLVAALVIIAVTLIINAVQTITCI